MIILLVRTHPTNALRAELLSVLRGVTSQTAARPGCLSAEVFEAEEDRSVLYLERWADNEAMRNHIKSPVYARILAAMDLSDSKPELACYEVGRAWGLELIEGLRSEQMGRMPR